MYFYMNPGCLTSVLEFGKHFTYYAMSIVPKFGNF